MTARPRRRDRGPRLDPARSWGPIRPLIRPAERSIATAARSIDPSAARPVAWRPRPSTTPWSSTRPPPRPGQRTSRYSVNRWVGRIPCRSGAITSTRSTVPPATSVLSARSISARRKTLEHTAPISQSSVRPSGARSSWRRIRRRIRWGRDSALRDGMTEPRISTASKSGGIKYRYQ